MAHIGQKNTFGRVGGLRAFLGLAQHALVLAVLCHVAHIARDARFLRRAHHFAGHGEPAKAAPGMIDAQFHMLLKAHSPAFGAAKIPPAPPVFRQDALFHGRKPLFGVGPFTQAELFVKNLVAGKFQLALAAAQFKHAQPAQATGQRKPRQAFTQCLMGRMQFAYVLMKPGNA